MKFFFFILVVISLATSISLAQVPQIITHQGFLADSAGQPVTGILPMTVRMFTDSLSGTEAFTQSFLTVNINSGVYTILIDVSTLSSGWPLNQYWLEMVVNTSVLSPRIRLTSVPYALYASKADSASQLADSNGDTRVDVNDAFDPEVIHFHVAGTERWAMREARLEPVATGGNLFIGINAGRIHNLTANDNTYVGNEAGYNSGVGLRNSFFGRSAGITNNSGSDNSFFGSEAGYSNTGSNNSFFGQSSGRANTSGGYNSFFGKDAGRTNSEGNYNSFFGHSAGLSNTVGFSNSFFGQQAGYYNTEGSSNSFFGTSAGQNNIVGLYNSFFGAGSGYTNTASSNSFFGHQAGFLNSSGSSNSFFGGRAGPNNTTGFSNSFFGKEAGLLNGTGSNNSFFGTSAGLVNYDGFGNSFFGERAGYNHTSGHGNSYFGQFAGFNDKTGGGNTFIGSESGFSDSLTQRTNATALGYYASATASDQVRIGNSSVTSIGGFTNWTNVSDGRFKIDVAEDVKGLDFILQLRPVTYNLDMVGLEKALHPNQSWSLSKMGSKESAQMTAMNQAAAEAKSKVRQSGFVAQEVEVAAKALGYDFSGIDAPKNENDFYGLRYAEFVVPLVKAMQELYAEKEGLEIKVSSLESENANLKSQFSSFTSNFSSVTSSLMLEIENLKAKVKSLGINPESPQRLAMRNGK